MKRTALVSFLVAMSAAAACDDDPTNPAIAQAPDAGGTDASATPDVATPPGPVVPAVVARFDPSTYELAEGVAVIDGVPLVGFAPQGRIVSVLPDGGTRTYASFASASSTYTLGLAVDPAKNLYIAVGQSGASPVPAPGIYRVGTGGGTPAAFAVPTSPAMVFPNGLDFIETDLFVSDSSGKIFRVDASGNSTVWLADAELAGSQAACGSTNGFDIGTNGIVHDDANVYVVNFDKGALLRIARQSNGSAGTMKVLYKGCDLFGADGLLLEKPGTFLVANNAKNRIQRLVVQNDQATLTTAAEGRPLDGPASIIRDGQRLLVTSSAFGSVGVDGGAPAPSLLSAPLP